MKLEQAFGIVLRELRREHGLTQEGLAFEAELQRNYVSLLERGLHSPTINVIFKLAVALKIAPTALLELVESKLKTSPKIRRKR